MTKIPKIPDEIFAGFCDDVKKAFGEQLVSVILFGSAGRGEYIPRKSDINFLVVLEDNSPSVLVAFRKDLARWRKRNVTTPLFLTEKYIQFSLDTFPLEFLEMQSAYKVLYGKDVLSGLRFEKSHLRTQAERELKGKLLHLRQEFLESHGKVESLTALVSSSLAAFAPVFRGLLRLKGKEETVKRIDLLQSVCGEFGLDGDLFALLFRIARGETRCAASEMSGLFDRYVREIDRLSQMVDTMEI